MDCEHIFGKNCTERGRRKEGKAQRVITTKTSSVKMAELIQQKTNSEHRIANTQKTIYKTKGNEQVAGAQIKHGSKIQKAGKCLEK